MKKYFSFLTAALMVFAACSEKNNPPKPQPIDDEDPQEEEALITIDGQFSDWSSAAGVVSSSMVDSNAGWMQADNQRVDGVKVMKAVADGNFIYVYYEVDMSVEYQGGTSWDGSAIPKCFAGPVDIYIDADGNSETGGINWVWSPIGWEYFFESGTGVAGETYDMADGAVYQFTGEDGTDIWAVDPPAREDITFDGMFKSAGVKEGNIVKVEMSFVRTFLPKITGNKVGIGVEIQSTGWTLHGVLPQVAQTVGGSLEATALLELSLPEAAK